MDTGGLCGYRWLGGTMAKYLNKKKINREYNQTAANTNEDFFPRK